MSLPKRFPDRDHIAAVRDAVEQLEAGAYLERQDGTQERRRLAGRVMARRDMGSAVFLDLVDRSGRLQLAFLKKEVAKAVAVKLGDVVGVEGVPGKTRRGEPTLFCEEPPLLLSPIATPLPDTFHGLTDVEARYRRRHLDLLMNEDVRGDFITRSRMISAIRRYLDDRGFLEVETPVLQPRYGGAFARPFTTHHNELDRDFYLRIATELYLKRLIVGGLERVYELGKDFRNEGVSFKHNPEFTMLEWYEAYADYRDTMVLIENLVADVTREVLGRTVVQFRGNEIDLQAPWRRLKFADALEQHGLWTRDEAELRRRLGERGIDCSKDPTWAKLADHALSHFVEPGLVQPTILHDYPVELSPFARRSDDDPGTVERFEYYVGGMELGNAYSEINDHADQAERFADQLKHRAAGDAEAEEGDPEYVEALTYGMPPTGGLGLGIDRFAMLLTGRDSIRDVVLFPALRDRG